MARKPQRARNGRRPQRGPARRLLRGAVALGGGAIDWVLYPVRLLWRALHSRSARRGSVASRKAWGHWLDDAQPAGDTFLRRAVAHARGAIEAMLRRGRRALADIRDLPQRARAVVRDFLQRVLRLVPEFLRRLRRQRQPCRRQRAETPLPPPLPPKGFAPLYFDDPLRRIPRASSTSSLPSPPPLRCEPFAHNASPSYVSHQTNEVGDCTTEMNQVNWLNLPLLVVSKIWGSLSNGADQIRMRIVCREWYTELPKLKAVRPWVIGSTMKDGDFHCISRKILQELRFNCKVPDGCFSGSSYDFLLSEASHGCSLWKANDGMLLPLPGKTYNKIVMVEGPDPLAFTHSHGSFQFLFGRPTEENSWKNAVCLDRCIEDIGKCGKELYAVNCFFRLHKLDKENCRMVIVGPEQRSDEIKELLGDGIHPDHILLADLNDELIVIVLGRCLLSAHLFKVVWIDEKRASLIMIDDLGDWSLFLGRNQSIALNSNDFPGICRNCLYIALEPLMDDVPQTVQVYCLQSRSVIHADYPSERLGVPFFYHPISACDRHLETCPALPCEGERAAVKASTAAGTTDSALAFP